VPYQIVTEAIVIELQIALAAVDAMGDAGTLEERRQKLLTVLPVGGPAEATLRKLLLPTPKHGGLDEWYVDAFPLLVPPSAQPESSTCHCSAIEVVYRSI
jgi:hypothetical protein